MKRTIDDVDQQSEKKDILSTLKDAGATIHSLHLHSWIAILPSFYEPSEELFDEVWKEHPKEYLEIKMYDKMVKLPRYQQAYGKSYSYSGSQSKAIPPTDLIQELMDKVNGVTALDDIRFNMCLCNWYEPKHYIGPHSDDTRQLHKHSPIASISWGYPRTFVLTPKGLGEKWSVVLQSGDLVIMGGRCQETHKHEITKIPPSEYKKASNRINFTFRCFVE